MVGVELAGAVGVRKAKLVGNEALEVGSVAGELLEAGLEGFEGVDGGVGEQGFVFEGHVADIGAGVDDGGGLSSVEEDALLAVGVGVVVDREAADLVTEGAEDGTEEGFHVGG